MFTYLQLYQNFPTVQRHNDYDHWLREECIYWKIQL